MSIHVIKEILNLVPESVGLMKQAHVEKNLPTNSKDSTLASALEISYMTKIAYDDVDPRDMARVDKAVELYGLADAVSEFTTTMVKRASDNSRNMDVAEEVHQAEYLFEGNLCGFPNIEKIAEQAQGLWDEYEDHITSDEVKRYAGAGYLNKEAAVTALRARLIATGNQEFEKVATALDGANDVIFTMEDSRAIANAVVGLDKEAGLLARGYDFYKDAFIVKEAAVSSVLMIKLAGKNIPVENIIRTGNDTISAYVGADVANGLGTDPQHIKAAAEALPLPTQQLLLRICK